MSVKSAVHGQRIRTKKGMWKKGKNSSRSIKSSNGIMSDLTVKNKEMAEKHETGKRPLQALGISAFDEPKKQKYEYRFRGLL